MEKKSSILLIITGSIAAVRCYDLIRQLTSTGHDITCVLTEAAKSFVTPMALTSLTGNNVYDDLFDLKDELEMGHIALSRAADVLLVAPASADMIAKMAQGLCNDLASTLLLATNKPVYIAPAMNTKMWEHPATQRNVKQLEADGIHMIPPASGDLACGEHGTGRMAEPEDIVQMMSGHLADALPLAGKHAIVTAGPTIEAIDPVRYLTNRSSGKQGYAIAKALAGAGARVTLISGPTALHIPDGIDFVAVESAADMFAACKNALPADIAVCAAAVSDWTAKHKADQKLKKEKGEDAPDEVSYVFVETPDILHYVSQLSRAKRPKLVIGFAAETEHVTAHAKAKLERKGCDWILANDVSDGKVFESDNNTIHWISKAEDEAWHTATKDEVALRLVDKITEAFV